MREIKFRQWISERARMHYGIGIVKDGMWAGPPSVTFSVNPLMQFTGLKDKNGVEIYEGDIVKTHFGGEDLIGVIKYADKWAKFYFAAKNKYGIGIAFDPQTVFHWYYADDDEETTSICEVIGNIWENPELANAVRGW